MRQTPICGMTECELPTHTGWYCSIHYNRWKAYGTPELFAFECRQCGKWFKSGSLAVKFCSPLCSKESRKVTAPSARKQAVAQRRSQIKTDIEAWPDSSLAERGRRLGIAQGMMSKDLRRIQGRSYKPLAEYRESIKNPRFAFKCETCGKDGYRQLGSKARRQGRSNRFCNLACQALSDSQNRPFDAVKNAELAAKRARKRALRLEQQVLEKKEKAQRRKLLQVMTAILKLAESRQSQVTCRCGVVFTRVNPWLRDQHCSDRCCTYWIAQDAKLRAERQARQKRIRRKADKYRRRGAIVERFDPVEVLKRDRWTCRLCGAKTPEKLRGSYAMNAPELDHIIPISRGGEHSRRNTQCACRQCNMSKSGTPRGQLLMFG